VNRLFTAIAGALLLTAPCRADAQRDQPVPGIDSARARLLAGFAARDTAQLHLALTDDAITLFKQPDGGRTNSGIAAILQFYTALFSSVKFSVAMEFTPMEHAVSGETALESGTFRMPGPGLTGVYVTMYRRGADGRWRITYWKAGPAV
jgi:ketosteroid isomerase-like protein